MMNPLTRLKKDSTASGMPNVNPWRTSFPTLQRAHSPGRLPPGNLQCPKKCTHTKSLTCRPPTFAFHRSSHLDPVLNPLAVLLRAMAHPSRVSVAPRSRLLLRQTLECPKFRPLGACVTMLERVLLPRAPSAAKGRVPRSLFHHRECLSLMLENAP